MAGQPRLTDTEATGDAGIKVLCITWDLDRPTTALFVGLRKAGVDIAVACQPDSKFRDALIEGGVRVMDFFFTDRVDRPGIARLQRELENGYDILHLFGNKAVQNGLIAAKGLPIRIVTYRGIVGNVSFLNPVSWMRFLNPRIDRIVCVAEAVRQFFLSMQPRFLRMPAERPVTIHKGHSLDWYTSDPADLEALGIPADAFTIACVANYRPRKGIELLVEAVSQLPPELNAHLVLVGRMDAPKLQAAIDRSGIGNRVHRLGHQDDAPAVAAACDVFALPSTKREGLARSLIEAMAYGVAPVVTDCGGSPELVRHNECGLVVPVRDVTALRQALERLIREPELRRRFGAAARERIAKDFRIEMTIEKTLAMYRELKSPG